jgi:hypothetical protein
MILQECLTHFYRISWKHQDGSVKRSHPLAGHRRLRFSFFLDEPVPISARRAFSACLEDWPVLDIKGL